MALDPYPEDLPTEVEPQALDSGSFKVPGLVGTVAEEDLDPPTPTTCTRELGRLGHYQLIRCIASGDTGALWEADHVHLHRRAAVKRMRDDSAASPEALRRFLVEASALARIRHAAVVQVYDYGLDAGEIPYVAMELVEGESLDARLKSEPLAAPAAVAIGRQIAEALCAAHAVGVLHRNLEPASVHLVRDFESGQEQVKLVDFGAAKAVGAPLEDATRTDFVSGAPAYMSPEQALGRRTLDPRCDVYSLGCALYHMVCGEPPFTGEATEVMAAHRYAVPAPPSRLGVILPVALEALILRMLAKEPEERPPMRAVADELGAFSDATARPETPATPEPPPPPQRSGVSALALAFAGGVGLGALLAGAVALL